MLVPLLGDHPNPFTHLLNKNKLEVFCFQSIEHIRQPIDNDS